MGILLWDRPGLDGMWNVGRNPEDRSALKLGTADDERFLVAKHSFFFVAFPVFFVAFRLLRPAGSLSLWLQVSGSKDRQRCRSTIVSPIFMPI
jgi:hypothetical protein